MEAIAIIMIFLLVVAVWVCLPFIPPFGEYLKRKDVEPVRVEPESEVDIRFFARGFREFMADRLAEPIARCRAAGGLVRGRLEDGTDYLVLDGKEHQGPPAAEAAGAASEAVIVSCGRLRLPPGNEFLLELHASESVAGGDDNIYRAILAEEDIGLGPRSRVLRWLHAGRAVNVGKGSRLWGRASADERIKLGDDSRFERLSAPEIAFGEPVEIGTEPPEGAPLGPDEIPRVIDDAAGRWLIKGRLEIPGKRRIESNLVATGEGRIGDGAHIAGSIKSHKDLHLGRGVVVEGSVVSERSIHLAAGCHVKGPVLAERSLYIERGCRLGSKESPTTVSSRQAEIAPGAVAYGTVWAHREGRVTGEAGKEG